MANYVKAVDFASKDALLSGDPAKIIKGTEIDTEYNAISVAISTKADTVSPTFTGTPTAPTASPGTNTTQVATTAFTTAAITAVLSSIYPVGSIYTNATNATNPGTLLGFGTWTAFGAGRVMVGFNASDPLFDTAEETGGTKDAAVVSHTHTASTSISDPGHAHSLNMGANFSGSYAYFQPTVTDLGFTLNSNSATTGITASTTVNSTGSSGTNANLQPYITVYMWKRTV
jgi:hypothetical protein